MNEEWRVVQRTKTSILKQLWIRLRSGLWAPTERFMTDAQMMPPIMGGSPGVVDKQVGAGADDYDTREDTTFTSAAAEVYLGCDQPGYERECIGCRQTNITVPKDATIDTAHLSVYGKNSLGTTFSYPVTIYGVDEDNFVAPTNYAEWAADPHTGASVPWTPGDWGGTYGWQDTPECKTLVQEIVNRAGWVSGNAMGFKVVSTKEGVDEDKRIAQWEYGDHTYGPKLHIEWSGEPPAGIPIFRRRIEGY